MKQVTLILAFALTSFDVSGAESRKVSVGAAKADVTPTEPVVLAGYGGRQGPYQSIDTKLWARAMVIGDESPVAVVVIDNCGVTRQITERLAKRLADHGIEPSHLVVAATHTHNAPTLTGYAPILWQGRTTPEQDRLTDEYTTFAIEQMQAAVVQALQSRQPMSLEWVQGRATFGGNRRVVSGGRWAGFGFQRSGPVDHSLPVLAARDASGTVRAVWANYACHCTTAGSQNSVGGDWAGFANEWMEKEFPAAVSLMTIGCGADVGPQPSGNLDHAEQHGKAIATEVKKMLAGKTKRVATAPSVTSKRVKLPLEDPKTREHWESQQNASGFDGQLATFVLEQAEKTGSIPSDVDYPLSVWKFGDDLAIVFMAGEVVVDYSVRLKHELHWERLWITAWANEMPGYIPSRRLLIEGGYETDFSQVYYGWPSRYAVDVENILIDAVHELVGERFVAAANQAPSPFHKLPSAEPLAFKRLAKWVATDKTGDEAVVYEKVRRVLPMAQPAIDRVMRNDGEKTEWYNFAGDFAERVFIRQQKRDIKLSWISPMIEATADEPVVLCFAGGIGWESQPKTEGFALAINDEEQLAFDVTRKPARWASADEGVELIYLPTWTSDVDSAGFFFVVLAEPGLSDDGRVSVAVRSLGEGSLRWFAIDSQLEIAARLKKLRAAFGL